MISFCKSLQIDIYKAVEKTVLYFYKISLMGVYFIFYSYF